MGISKALHKREIATLSAHKALLIARSKAQSKTFLTEEAGAGMVAISPADSINGTGL